MTIDHNPDGALDGNVAARQDRMTLLYRAIFEGTPVGEPNERQKSAVGDFVKVMEEVDGMRGTKRTRSKLKSSNHVPAPKRGNYKRRSVC